MRYYGKKPRVSKECKRDLVITKDAYMEEAEKIVVIASGKQGLLKVRVKSI